MNIPSNFKCICLPLLILLMIPLVGISQLAEHLDRGVVALNQGEERIYVGWRLLKSDPEDIAFNIYRKNIGFNDYQKVNQQPVTGVTNFVDTTCKPGFAYHYKVTSIIDGKETEATGYSYVFSHNGNQPWFLSTWRQV